jgi:hypothetical protein
MRRSGLLVVAAFTVGWTGSGAVSLFERVDDGAAVEDRGRSRGAAWGDYDGDGDPDLFVTRPTWEGDPRPQRNRLYRNDDGRLVPSGVPTGEPGGWEGAVWVDIDNDGDLDLHVVGRQGSGSLLFENRAGALVRRQGPFAGVESASMACWADADADGLLDVFFTGYGRDTNALFRGLGDWRFAETRLPPQAAGAGRARACAWGDTDGDGLPELVVANARQPNTLLRNRGAMRLVPDTTSPLQRGDGYGYGLSWADADGDGHRDLFVANFDSENALYLGDGQGRLVRVPLGDSLRSPATKGHVWGDFDLDGRLDLYLGSGTPGPGMVNRLYRGTPTGSFRPIDGGPATSDADTSAAIAAADFDDDGDLDLFVANWGSLEAQNRLYRNTTAGRGWLEVRLEGVRSNRMGIGARVSAFLSTGGQPRWVHRWLDATTGYAGQNEPVVHFGLGAAGVDSLVVRWPSGTVDRFAPVPTSTAVRVREGAGGLEVADG